MYDVCRVFGTLDSESSYGCEFDEEVDELTIMLSGLFSFAIDLDAEYVEFREDGMGSHLTDSGWFSKVGEAKLEIEIAERR